MTTLRFLVAFPVLMLAASAARPDVLPAQRTSAADMTPVIAVGDFTVSRYLFEKAYRQFMASGPRRDRGQPTAEETSRWFRLYLAQQVIKADLMARGQLARPEVSEMIERMERYMLVQPHGPFYQELVGREGNAARRERRQRVLATARFAANSGNIARLWTAIAPTFSQGKMPQGADVATIGELILAEYVFEGETRHVTALGFVRDFQQGIARLAPRTAAELREQIEDIALAEFDLTEARALGLDCTPRFLADRHNFALNQALALFESEELAPRARATPAAEETYYRHHPDRFSAPDEVRGQLLIYASIADVQRALGREENGTGKAVPLEALEDYVIYPQQSLFKGPSFSALVSMPNGRRIGPVSHAGRPAVFVKRAVGKTSLRPFAEVREEIRALLLRQEIERLELEYLERDPARIHLGFDPATYGLDAAAIRGMTLATIGADQRGQ